MRQIGGLQLAPLLFLVCGGCGYRVAGRTDLLPKTIHSIAVPAFGNLTIRYKLGERLPADIAREFIERTRYAVIADPNKADAVLNGAIVNFVSFPTTYDPVTSRASAVQVVVNLQLSLVERSTGKMLFNRPGMEVRERYEISVSSATYFDESGPALDRLAKDVARTVVSAVLENF